MNILFVLENGSVFVEERRCWKSITRPWDIVEQPKHLVADWRSARVGQSDPAPAAVCACVRACAVMILPQTEKGNECDLDEGTYSSR